LYFYSASWLNQIKIHSKVDVAPLEYIIMIPSMILQEK